MKKSLAELSFPEAPKIVVKPPGPKTTEFLEHLYDYIPKGAFETLLPVVWETAKGATVRDIDGNIYIDFSGGAHATSAGHANLEVAQAVYEAANKLTNCEAYSFPLRIEAAKRLVEACTSLFRRSDLKTCFAMSGTEAVEMAVNIARSFTKKQDILTTWGSYHGKGFFVSTLTPTLRSSLAPYTVFAPGTLYAPGSYCYRCAFGLEYPDCDLWCVDYIAEVIKAESKYEGRNNTAAVIVETWPTAGHLLGSTPEGYLPKLKKICEENEVLLIADEITCGMGRCVEREDHLWYCQHEDVVPDILTTGKGLSNAFPCSAVVAPAEIMDSMGKHFYREAITFGMNNMSCAAVIRTLDLFKELKLTENVVKVGKYMKKRLMDMKDEHKLIGDIGAMGFHIAIELVKDRKTKEPAPEETLKVYMKALEKGLFTTGMTWWTPSLVLTHEQAEKGLDIFEESLKEVERKL